MVFFRKRKVNIKLQENGLLLNSRLNECSFHAATKFSLQLAQCFSYFPLDIGVTSHNLKFKWLHWRVLYALVTFLFFVAEFIAVVCYHILSIPKQDNLLCVTIFVFYGAAVLQYVLFFKLTLEWPAFAKEWHKIEIRMRNYMTHSNLRVQLNIITTVIITIAGVEHGLVNAKNLIKYLTTEPTIYEAFQVFFTKSYKHIFKFFEYSVWKGIIAQFLNLQRTFYWNYADVFVMIIGWSFTFRLKQISQRLKILCQLNVNDVNTFRNIRGDYVKLIELCETINHKISSIIILCFSLNIFFILVQLYNSLNKMEDPVEKAYFYISFGLLVIRITCLCIFGGEVFEEWKKIGGALFSVQSPAYNIEVQRFIDHAITYELVLTGRNFFRISRSLILKIASAIVTYELILIQFNSQDFKNNGNGTA